MASREEQIVIKFDGGDVGVHYLPGTSEATSADHHRADEVALWGLCHQCIDLRRQHGLPVPAVMTMLVEAETFRDLQ